MSDRQLMLVPGGTSPGAVTMTYAAMHKLWEFYEDEERTGVPRGHRIIVAPRPMEECLPPVAERSNAALQGRIDHVDPSTDIIIETSGSSSGTPHLVGLSYAACVASARATHQALGGPGRWVVALPVHHIAGLLTLIRCCVAETSPVIADMTHGFDAEALERACRTVITSRDTVDGSPRSEGKCGSRAYLSLVAKQLRDALDVGGTLIEALAALDAILVGGSAIDPALCDRARAAGVRIVTTYGMTETCGGCVYDGRTNDGTRVHIEPVTGRIMITGPTLMDGYVDIARTPQFSDIDGQRWLTTGDLGVIDNGVLRVTGRADDVIVSGGINVVPARVEAVIADLPEVSDVAVVPIADDTWGQIAAALVVPVGDSVSLDDLAERIRSRVGDALGRDHAPRLIVTTDSIARTSLGKTIRPKAIDTLTHARGSARAWER